MQKKTTSININKELWQKFRILCLKRQKNASKLIEELVNKEVKDNEEKLYESYIKESQNE